MGFTDYIKNERAKYNMPVMGGHRGCKCELRENTIACFEKAKEHGAKYVEIDVQLTKDNVAVIYHDIYLQEKTPLEGLIHDYTYNELKKAFEICTLEQAVEWCKKENMYILLEIKCNNALMHMDMKPLAKEIASVLRAKDFVCGCMPFSINYEFLSYLKDYAPEIEIGLIISFIPQNPVKLVQEMRANLYLCYLDVFKPETLTQLKQAGILVSGSVVNTVQAYKKAVNLGVDMFETDCPELIAKER